MVVGMVLLKTHIIANIFPFVFHTNKLDNMSHFIHKFNNITIRARFTSR